MQLGRSRVEKWKWIEYKGHDFTGKYLISDSGRVKSVDRHNEKTGQLLRGQIIKQRAGSGRGNTTYRTVTLWDNGKQVDVEVHRLVANAFLPNPDDLPCVNHIDGNGGNNTAENLEWCTFAENARHSVNVLGNNPRKWKSKAVAQKTLSGEVVRIWENAWDIQRELGYCQVSISRCCRRVKRSGEYRGYIWDFA